MAQAARSRSHAHGGWWVASVLIVVALVCGAGYLWYRSGGSLDQLSTGAGSDEGRCSAATAALTEAQQTLASAGTKAKAALNDADADAEAASRRPAETADEEGPAYAATPDGTALIAQLRPAASSAIAAPIPSCSTRSDAEAIDSHADELKAQADALTKSTTTLRQGMTQAQLDHAAAAAPAVLSAADQALADAHATDEYATSDVGRTLIPDVESRRDALRRLTQNDTKNVDAALFDKTVDAARSGATALTVDLAEWKQARADEATAVSQKSLAQAAFDTSHEAEHSDEGQDAERSSDAPSTASDSSAGGEDIWLHAFCKAQNGYITYRASNGWSRITANQDYLQRQCD
ncbi:hypothetical protein [Pseudoclavibacter sp. 13-3]|uniref:hypothetical protein n=1 Tax=Pseudoclavibacter sp. 13-3 TaxID=2901228 RepID=UPI001E46560D|nr:hypothetical protein [Pseudoclavibacter sp. 13-3]MCD7102078.1 hypothetical protein [Pseudoclavibacter sp. 13-3]